MRNITITLFIFFNNFFFQTSALAIGDPQEGYAIVRSDTIYGKIEINFDSGSVIVHQDSINRMFLSDIQQITILNEKRETFIPISSNGHTVFYKLLVDGDYSLLEAGESFFYTMNDTVVLIERDSDLYNAFGKKQVKDYIFIRNIDTGSKTGLIDLFRYFNKYGSF